MGLLDLAPPGRELVQTSAPVYRVTGLTQRIINGTRFIAMTQTSPKSLRRKSSADDGTTVVVDLHQILKLNSARSSIFSIKSQRPIIMPIYLHAVINDVVDKRIFAVALTVIAKARMGSYELQGIVRGPISARSLPRRRIFDNGGSLRRSDRTA